MQKISSISRGNRRNLGTGLNPAVRGCQSGNSSLIEEKAESLFLGRIGAGFKFPLSLAMIGLWVKHSKLIMSLLAGAARAPVAGYDGK
jgi:hypothetical protein